MIKIAFLIPINRTENEKSFYDYKCIHRVQVPKHIHIARGPQHVAFHSKLTP